MFPMFFGVEKPLSHCNSQSQSKGLSLKSTADKVPSPSNGSEYTDDSWFRANNISSMAINPSNRCKCLICLNLFSLMSSRRRLRWYWNVYGMISSTELFRSSTSRKSRSLWKLSTNTPVIRLFCRLRRNSSNSVLKTLPGSRVRRLSSRYK